MRLAKVNRLTLVSTAIVSALLTGSGCQPPKAQPPHPAARPPMGHSDAMPATMVSATMPDTMPSSMPTSMPTSMPASMPVTMPTTMTTDNTLPATVPAVATPVPVPTPATQAVEPAATQAVLPAATQAVSPAATQAVVPAATQAVVPAATQAVAPPATQTAMMPATQAASQPAVEATAMPTSMPVIADAPLPTDPKIIESDAQLAERIAGIAELEFTTKVTNPNAWPFIWQHQAALFRACNHLDPKSARFPRLQADAYAQLHDPEGEMKALGAAIIAQQAHDYQPDEFVWNRDLDLHLNTYQTATDKIQYLQSIIGSTGKIPTNVRAHAGYQLAQVYILRGDEDSAAATLKEALTNCPASVECLKLRYQLLPPTATRFERCTQLLDLLKANPLLSQYSAELADLVAESGLVQESLPWYYLAIGTLHRQGDAATHSMLNLAAELYIADQLHDALELNNALLKIDPTNTQAHFLQVLITRKLDDKAGAADAMQHAGNAMSNRIIEAMNAAASKDAIAKPTTRPINDPTPLDLPDLNTAVAQVNRSGSPAIKEEFAEAVSDMAMLEGYFAQQPDMAAKLLDALKSVVPDNSPEVARLTGWLDLLAKKTDDAKTQFVSVAEKDPLAELGMIKVMMDGGDPHDHELAEGMAQQLIQKNASGLLGAILWEPLHSARVKLIPDQQAVAMQAPLADFPKTLMSLVDQPQTIYSLHVEPEKVGSYTGEPLLAKVTVDNLTSYDLTIGPDGVLKPELLFKVSPEIGAKWPSFDAFDNIAGPTVLGGHTEFSQIIRLDQTQLLGFLDSQSNFAFEVSGFLTSNQVVNRLGGYPVSFFKKFYRQAAPPNDANMKSFADSAANGRPDQQITSLSIVQRFVFQMRAVKNPTAAVKQYITAMTEVIHHARHDPLPAVAAWACKCEAELDDSGHFETVVRDMAEDPDWRHRQLAVTLLANLEPKVRDELAAKLAMDPQQSVEEDARVLQGLLKLPAMPTTMPTTKPSAATLPTTKPTGLPDFTPVAPAAPSGP